MSTIAQVKKIVQRLLGPRAEELARETKFVIRTRKIDGPAFVQGLVFSYLQEANATSADVLQMLERREVSISESGLSQRFTPQATQFLKEVMQEMIKEQIQAEQPAPAEILRRFRAVIAEDSSTIRLPDTFKEEWPGCGGGQGQSQAGLKLHLRWDLKQGRLQGPVITPSRQGDQSCALRQEGIPAGVLNLTDEGYCSLLWLKKQPGFFLTRPRAISVFLDRERKQRLDLEQIGPKVSNETWQGEVLVGEEAQLPARLILVRVPEEVIAVRQAKIRQEAKRRGRAPNAQALMRAQWTILITNVPESLLSLSEVIVLQRARWQIERLFRLWKEGGQVDCWGGHNPERILCEFYAKVIGLLLQHWFLVIGTWHDPYRSLFKAAVVFRHAACDLLLALNGESGWKCVTDRMIRSMQACRLHRRNKHPSHPQLLLEGLDWPLT